MEKEQSPFIKHWLNSESSTLRYREPEVCVAAEWTHHDVFLAFTGFVSCFLMWVGGDSLFCLNLFTRVWTLRAWTSLVCTSSHWNMRTLLNCTLYLCFVQTFQIKKKPQNLRSIPGTVADIQSAVALWGPSKGPCCPSWEPLLHRQNPNPKLAAVWMQKHQIW